MERLPCPIAPPPTPDPGRRRRWLAAGVASLGAGFAMPPDRPRAAVGVPALLAAGGPTFGLGVASGCLGATRVLLWTRLVRADGRLAAGIGVDPVTVRWTLASDPRLLHPVASGTVVARPESAHAVRVEVEGLAPDRWFWYRFTVDGASSRIGRTRTLPAPGAAAARLRVAVASCQNYEHGHYAAWRHIVADDPDLVVHVGDYVYETTWGRDLVRPLGLPEARSLADYRLRYEICRRDPDLQTAHAELPWAVVWDDHEVMNDYAGLTAERLSEWPTFAHRRAQAYQAWLEHMPVPASVAGRDGTLRIHRSLRAGDLLCLYLLDCRQYRSVQACPPPGRRGGNVVEAARCAALADGRRTMLGFAQERWLADAFGRSPARWNVIAQPTLMAPLAVPGRTDSVARTRTDGWDGYPLARQRLLDAMVGHRLANPVVVGGDLHAFHVADIGRSHRPGSAPVAAEFVGTSITSQAADQAFYDRLRAANEHLVYANGTQRGYLRLTISPARIRADLVGLQDVRRADSPAAVQSTWVVEAGRPGVQPG